MIRGALLSICLIVCSSLSGRELIKLTNGFSIEADSHVVENALLVAKVGAGTLQFQQSDVASIQDIGGNSAVNAVVSPEPAVLSTEELLRSAARTHGLPEAFVRSVAAIESGLKQNALSRKGALGLMQLMPQTAADLGVDPLVAASNALGGAAYLRRLLLQYGGNAGLALAAYNAGPGAVKHYGGIPPYEETRRYVLKVLAEYARQQAKASLPKIP